MYQRNGRLNLDYRNYPCKKCILTNLCKLTEKEKEQYCEKYNKWLSYCREFEKEQLCWLKGQDCQSE